MLDVEPLAFCVIGCMYIWLCACVCGFWFCLSALLHGSWDVRIEFIWNSFIFFGNRRFISAFFTSSVQANAQTHIARVHTYINWDVIVDFADEVKCSFSVWCDQMHYHSNKLRFNFIWKMRFCAYFLFVCLISIHFCFVESHVRIKKQSTGAQDMGVDRNIKIVEKNRKKQIKWKTKNYNSNGWTKFRLNCEYEFRCLYAKNLKYLICIIHIIVLNMTIWMLYTSSNSNLSCSNGLLEDKTYR